MEIRYLYGVKLSDKEKEYLTEKILKVKKLISGYKDSELKAEIEVGQDKKGFWRVEVMVKTPKDFYRAEKTTDDFEGSVDQVQEALMKIIRRDKEKKVTLTRKRDKTRNV